MGRGFLAGIFWGGLVGLGLLVVSGLVVERQQLSLPKPEAVPVEVPAGTEFDQARPETEPVAPSVETRPSSEAVSGVTPPADLVETPPAFDTSSLGVPTPTVDAPDALGDVPEVADGVEVDVTGPGPSNEVNPVQGELSVPETPVEAPETETEAPEPAPTVEVEEDRAPDVVAVAPTQDQVDVAPTQPVIEVETEAPAMETTSEAPESGEAPEAIAAPEIESEGEADPAPVVVEDTSPSLLQPVDELEDQATEVETNRLPRIGDAPEAESAPEEEPSLPVVRRLPGTAVEEEPESEGEETVETAPATSADGPALQAYRVPFENTSGAPVIAVVLRHEGQEAPDASTLESLPATISFAVDAGQSGAADIAAAYRSAGREVVMIPALPDGATPQDVEVAMRVNFETIPEAIAVMDMEGGNFRTDRFAVAQVIQIVSDSGHGLITFPRGLNPAHQIAEREGVPAGLIFRNIDGGGESAGAISRALDRAAFRARQSDAVILVGSTRPDTLKTLVEWAMNNGGDSVQLAPVSAALDAD